jgi:hypothetical protein
MKTTMEKKNSLLSEYCMAVQNGVEIDHETIELMANRGLATYDPLTKSAKLTNLGIKFVTKFTESSE